MWVCPVKVGNLVTKTRPVVISGLGCDKCFAVVGFFPSALCVFHGEGGSHLFSWGKQDYFRLETEVTGRAKSADPVLFLAFVRVLCCEGQHLLPSVRYHLVPNACFSRLMPCWCEIPKVHPGELRAWGWAAQCGRKAGGDPVSQAVNRGGSLHHRVVKKSIN